MNKRLCGILLPLSSLPSKYGIGEFNNECFKLIDLLKLNNVKIWQMLPLNPLGFGNSPYSSICNNAIDPIYISLDDLIKEGYDIKIKDVPNFNETKVEYSKVREFKEFYLKKIFSIQKDTDSNEFKTFLINNPFIIKYAQFLVLLKKNNNTNFWTWNELEKNAAYNNFDFTPFNNEILYYEWQQFIAFKQFKKIKDYAIKKDISLMGDIPFYLGSNSSDAWSNQDELLLDENGKPEFVGGCPPDYFSKTGQRWGNPIYDRDYMKDDKFSFLINRIKNSANLYSFLRIDHFRAFDTYYKIPEESLTAEIGTWEKAYGEEFFNLLKKEKINLTIIAEDLGELFDSVIKLRNKFRFPGMNILEFTIFDKNFKVKKNQAVYTGTHDNQTIRSWKEILTKKENSSLEHRFKVKKIYDSSFNWRMISYALSLKADYVFIPVWDLLNLKDEDGRMNTPGTVGEPNWQFKLKNLNKLKKELKILKAKILEYKR